MSKLSKDSWFRWVCDDPAALSEWGLDLLQSQTFMDAPDDVRARLPLGMRLAMRFAPGIVRRKSGDYRFNVFRLRPLDKPV